MFCENCGNELKENALFCNKCGCKTGVEEPAVTEVPVTENVVEDACDTASNVPETSEDVVNTEMPQEEPPVKKKKKLWVVLTAVVLIIALLGTGFVFAFPYVSNTFWDVVLSDTDYFKHVIKNNASDYIGDATDEYAQIMDIYKKGDVYQSDLSLNIGDKTKELVSEYSYGSLNIDWFKNFSAKVYAGYKDGKLFERMTYNVNDKKFTDYNLIMASDGMYIDFPGLSDGGVRIEYDENSEIMMQALDIFYEVAPDADVLKELFVRYINCLADSVTDVEKTTKQVHAGDVTKKYTQLSAEVDEDIVEAAIVNVLVEARNDKKIKDIIEDFCKLDVVDEDFNEVYEQYQLGIDDMLEDVDLDEEFAFYFNIWINGKGEIVGMGAEFDNGEICYVNALDGKTLGTLFKISIPEFDLKFEGTGKLASGKFNGDYNLNVTGVRVLNVKLSDFDYSLAKDGIYNGKVEFALGKAAKQSLKLMNDSTISMLADAKITLDLKTTKKNMTVVDIDVSSGNDNFFTLGIKTDVVKADMPKISNYIESDDYRAYSEWNATLGKNILEKLTDLGFDIYSIY